MLQKRLSAAEGARRNGITAGEVGRPVWRPARAPPPPSLGSAFYCLPLWGTHPQPQCWPGGVGWGGGSQMDRAAPRPHTSSYTLCEGARPGLGSLEWENTLIRGWYRTTCLVTRVLWFPEPIPELFQGGTVADVFLKRYIIQQSVLWATLLDWSMHNWNHVFVFIFYISLDKQMQNRTWHMD